VALRFLAQGLELLAPQTFAMTSEVFFALTTKID